MNDWFEAYLTSWGTLDVDQVASWFTDDAVYFDMTIGHGAHGISQVRKFAAASFKNVPDARFEFVRGHADDTGYSIEWIMQPMNVPGVSVGRLRDGKICENRDYWNGAAYKVPNT